MKLISAIIRPAKLDEVKQALTEAGVQGMSITEIKGFGRTHGKTEVYRGSAYQVDFVPKIKVEIICDDGAAVQLLQVLEESAKTGKIGDGKVYVVSLDEVLRIRTGQRGHDAL